MVLVSFFGGIHVLIHNYYSHKRLFVNLDTLFTTHYVYGCAFTCLNITCSFLFSFHYFLTQLMRINTLQSSLLLLLISCGVSSTAVAQERSIKQPTNDPLEIGNPSPELIRTRLAQQAKRPKKTVSLPTVYRADNSCNLVTNGDFEVQSAAPSQTGNIASRVPASASQLPNWFAPNFTTPDYLARNASNPSMRPATSSRGGFVPLNGTNNSTVDGTVGIAFTTLLSTTPFYPEYVAQQLAQPLSGGAVYYAEFWTLTASQFSLSNRLGLYVSNNANWEGQTNPTSGSATNYTDPPIQLPLGGRGITSNQLNNPNQWVRVSGTFTANTGDNFVNIGYPNPVGNSQVSFAGQIPASYYYIDDVAIYKVPTAGPDRACSGGPIQLGDGCAIPGATYAWRLNGNSTVLSTTLQWSVPSATTARTYVLTVTLPDGSNSTSSTTIAGCPVLPPIAGPDVVICRGSSATLQGSPAVNGASYAWRNEQGILISTSLGPVVVTPNTPTTYTLTVNMPDGSVRTSSTRVSFYDTGASVGATVNDVNHDGGVVCAYSMLSVYASLPNVSSTASVFWRLEGIGPNEYTDFLETGSNQYPSIRFRPTSPVLYGAIDSRQFNAVLYVDGCAVGAYGFQVVNTFDGISYCGIMARQSSVPTLKSELYPNPATSNVQLSLTGISAGESATVSFYNQRGKLAKVTKAKAGATISTADLPVGIYQVHILVGTSTIKQRISIER
jgi:Secretion system C-terminal sorting domain